MNIAKIIMLVFVFLLFNNKTVTLAEHELSLIKNDDFQSSKFNINNKLLMKSIDFGGKLLFSDSPEYVEEPGILYQDIIDESGTIFYYHLPEKIDNQKLVVIMENIDQDKENHILIERYGKGGPSSDYLKVGKEATTEYYKNKSPILKILSKDNKLLLDEKDNKRKLKEGELVEGFYSIRTKYPLKITILMLPYDENPFSYLENAKILKRDKHNLRGSFLHSNRFVKNENIYTPKKDGKMYFDLANNTDDIFMYGIDSLDNQVKTQNYGNYGVAYSISLNTKGEGVSDLYMMPLGGVYAGALNISKNGKMNLLKTPKNKKFMGEDNNFKYIMHITSFKNSDGLNFEFTPPGASNLPVRFLIIPREK